MAQEIVDQLVNELMEELESDKLVLPSLPEVALKVRDAIEDPEVTTPKISQVVGTDAALTARLIQVANSPLVRGNKHIDSLEMAITRMGGTMVRNVVNSLIVKQIFQPTTELSEKKFRAFWEHSTQVAAISQALSTFARLKPDLALLGGLVHDIGTLPVIKRAEDMPELLEDEALLDRVIEEVHPKIGAAMLKKWEFPNELVLVAAEHEDWSRKGEDKADYVDVIIAANLQSYMETDHRLAGVEWNQVPAFAKLGLSTDVSVVDLDETAESIKAVQMALCA